MRYESKSMSEPFRKPGLSNLAIRQVRNETGVIASTTPAPTELLCPTARQALGLLPSIALSS